MNFSDTTNKNGLIQNCESLCNLGDAGISGSSTQLLKFTGYLNQAWEKVAMAILKVDKNWRWDDNNYVNPNGFPVATQTLVTDQRDYILPRATNSSDLSTLWRIYKVRIKNIDGEWYDLSPLSADENETDNDSGLPIKYRLIGNSIRLSDPPKSGVVTLSSGLQVWFQREFIPFVSTDTTKNPGFMSSYHHLLPLDASATYLLPTNTNLANEYITLFKSGLEELKDSYAQRNDDPKTIKRMIPNIENNE